MSFMLRCKHMLALRQNSFSEFSDLDITGMIRFFQQSELGQGDYTKARHQWLGQPDSQTVAEELKQWRESRQV